MKTIFSLKKHIYSEAALTANAGGWSDIDIALVSDPFEGIRMKDRDKIRKITLSASSKLEAIPFNTNDFSLADPFAREIMETGIKLI